VLLVIVMRAEPLPLPLQAPDVVIATVRPELAVAATLKVAPLVAIAGAEVVTVMVWPTGKAVTFFVTSGAAL
jgi:hypothetical protein